MRKQGHERCHSVIARIDPEDPECAGTVTVQDFGPNFRQLIVFGMEKFGGPTFVIAVKGGDPRPKAPPNGRPDP